MSLWRDVILPLAVLVLVVAWLAISVALMALTLRERRRPPGTRRRWALHGIWAWLAGSLALGLASGLVDPRRLGPSDNPSLWWSLALVPVLVPAEMFALTFAINRLRGRGSGVGRAQRKARRGDLAGAIADVEAALGPHLDPPAAGPPPVDRAGPVDPWAPPMAAGPTPRGRVALAERLNLLGWLEAQRGDWPRALALFERADGLGVGSMFFRANRAAALIRLGRGGEAGELIDQILAAVPEHNSALSVHLLAEVARLLATLGRFEEARSALGRAERHWRQFGPLRLAYRNQLLAPLRTARAALDPMTTEADARPGRPDQPTPPEETRP